MTQAKFKLTELVTNHIDAVFEQEQEVFPWKRNVELSRPPQPREGCNTSKAGEAVPCSLSTQKPRPSGACNCAVYPASSQTRLQAIVDSHTKSIEEKLRQLIKVIVHSCQPRENECCRTTENLMGVAGVNLYSPDPRISLSVSIPCEAPIGGYRKSSFLREETSCFQETPHLGGDTGSCSMPKQCHCSCHSYAELESKELSMATFEFLSQFC